MLEKLINKCTAIDRVLAGEELSYDDGIELMNYNNYVKSNVRYK